MVPNMIVPSLDGQGWCECDGKILPVWYDIPQLPPSLPRYPKKKQTGQAKKSSTTVPPCKKTKINELEDVRQCGDISCDGSSDEHESTSSSEYEMWEDSDWD